MPIQLKIRRLFGWFFAPLKADEPVIKEALPTEEYFAWERAGKPRAKEQSAELNLTWDGKRDDNPMFDARLSEGRAKLRILLTDQAKNQKRKEEHELPSTCYTNFITY